MSRDLATILDVSRAARLILEFTANMNLEAFVGDVKTQSAVLHQLLVIGEAVKRLSGEFRTRHPVAPWDEIAGMRDKLIHAYDAVDLDEVWNTADRDIPALLRAIEPLMAPAAGL
jgi:uncharacterized protein with HEPN domain